MSYNVQALIALQDPIPNIRAKPNPSNILEWHFVIIGEPDTPYAGGTYHGKLLFPPNYPFKPPGILFVTPSGRFKPGEKICFSFSDFHPEAWNPIWQVSTILNATQSFMNEESQTTGSMSATLAQRRQLAAQSLANSCKHPMFRQLFPDLVEQNAGTAAGPSGSASAGAQPSNEGGGTGAATAPGAAAPPVALGQAPAGRAPRNAGDGAQAGHGPLELLRFAPAFLVVGIAVSVMASQLR